MSAKFGPAGNSDSFSKVHKSSLAAPKWIAEFGLDCYEYQCGKGVNVGEGTARKIGAAAREAGIRPSPPPPHFIKPAHPEPGRPPKTNRSYPSSLPAAGRVGGGPGGVPSRAPR